VSPLMRSKLAFWTARTIELRNPKEERRCFFSSLDRSGASLLLDGVMDRSWGLECSLEVDGVSLSSVIARLGDAGGMPLESVISSASTSCDSLPSSIKTSSGGDSRVCAAENLPRENVREKMAVNCDGSGASVAGFALVGCGL
jgi:hypothetical protein